jgi:hypothetical protein
MGSGRRREAYAVAAALAAHLALLLVSPHPPRSVPSEAPSDRAETTIDLEPNKPAPEAEPAPTPAALPEAPESAAKAEAPAKGSSAPHGQANAKIAAAVKEPSLEPPSAGSPQGVPVPEAPPASPAPAPAPGPAPQGPAKDEYGGPAGGSDVAALPPGLGGASLWSIPGMIPGAAPPKPASTVATGPAPVDPNVAGQVLEGSLGKKDKAAGISLPAAGTVATQLADAVRTSAPLNARATFEVKLGAEGQVEGVRLVSASDGDASTWARVVASAKGAIGARKLTMKGDGKGATVTIKVESKVQFPSGTTKKLDVEPLCAEEQIAKMINSLQNGPNADLQRGPIAEPGMGALPSDDDDDGTKKRRFCIPVGVAVRADLSDIGAHAVNVVKSTFTVSRPGEKALDPEAVRPIDTRVPWAPEDPTKVRPALPKKKKKKKP